MTDIWLNTSTGEHLTVTATPNFTCQRCGLHARDDMDRFDDWAANGWQWRCPDCAKEPA